MQQISRGKRVWLIAMGATMGIAALASLITAPVMSVVLVGGYAAIVGAAYAETNGGQQLRRTLTPLAVPLTGTPAAREAVSRARRLSGMLSPEAVTDIGLISNVRALNGQFRPAGIAQAIALDDEAIQPFVKISVPTDRSHRSVLVKFEILDRSGKTQFSRETEQFVRDGDNLIACDRQMLLAGNTQIGRAGAWELQVSINGVLAAAYTFTVTASQQGSRLSADGEIGNMRPNSSQFGQPGAYQSSGYSSPGSTYGSAVSPVNTNTTAADDDAPQSLDDLLRGTQGGRS